MRSCMARHRVQRVLLAGASACVLALLLASPSSALTLTTSSGVVALTGGGCGDTNSSVLSTAAHVACGAFTGDAFVVGGADSISTYNLLRGESNPKFVEIVKRPPVHYAA